MSLFVEIIQFRGRVTGITEERGRGNRGERGRERGEGEGERERERASKYRPTKAIRPSVTVRVGPVLSI